MAEEYRWRAGGAGIDPQVAGAELARIGRKRKALRPAYVVDASRPPDAPLHGAFEWDDSIAGESYRVEQAKSLLRHLVVVRIGDGPVAPVRAFVSVESTDKSAQPQYVKTVDALRHPRRRSEVLQQALDDLNSWRRKYSRLKELARVFDAIDEVSAA
jgi:hypothetical protein